MVIAFALLFFGCCGCPIFCVVVRVRGLRKRKRMQATLAPLALTPTLTFTLAPTPTLAPIPTLTLTLWQAAQEVDAAELDATHGPATMRLSPSPSPSP